MFLLDISRSVLPANEPVLGVARIGKVGVVVRPLELASPSLIMAPEPPGSSSRLSLLLWMGDNEVALGHGDSSKDWRSLRHSHRGTNR